jgi:hypothetical protein
MRTTQTLLLATFGAICLVGWVSSPALAQKGRKPLSKAEVLELLQNGVASTRIDELVRAYGINFEITPEMAVEFKDAGARDDLIRTLKEIAPKPEPVAPAPKTEPAPAQPAVAPAVPPVLMLETTPPGAEVYVDEERAGKTGPEGKLKITTLSPGEHRVRISAQGYDDLTRSVELTNGQTNTMAIALALQKPATPDPAANSKETPQKNTAGQPSQPNPMDAYKAILGGMMGGEQGDPNVKRFMVTHDHGKSVMGYGGGLCSGWLIIGNGRVQFSSNNENDAFDVAAGEIAELQIKSNHIRFRTGNRKYHLMTQDIGMFGGESQGPGAIRKAFESIGLKVESK